MAVIPARMTHSVMDTQRVGPRPAEAFFGGAAQGLAGVLQGEAKRRQMQMNQMTAAFPSLISKGMVAQSPEGAIPYGGMQWDIQTPPADYAAMNEMLEYKQGIGELPPSPAEMHQLAASDAGKVFGNPNIFIPLAKAAMNSDNPDILSDMWDSIYQVAYKNVRAKTDPTYEPPSADGLPRALIGKVKPEDWKVATPEEKRILLKHFTKGQ